MQTPQQSQTSRLTALTRSVSFWLFLSVALGLYGLAVLSPKLASREQLLFASHAQQVHLLREEQRLTRLHRVTLSLQQDADLVRKLLQNDQKPRQNGEEIIPLEGNLVYREQAADRNDSALSTIRNSPWYAPIISLVGESSDVRGVLLLSSVVLILFAFSSLQLSEEPASESLPRLSPEEVSQKPSIVTKWLARYDRTAEEEERRKMLERLARLESEAEWEMDALPVELLDEEEDVDDDLQSAF